MGEFVKSQDIMRKLKSQVLGGAKTPHECSFPVLRMEDGRLRLACYVQFLRREQLQKKMIQRPSYWYLADLTDGELCSELDCHSRDFCTAPFDRVYQRGEAKRQGTKADVLELYNILDTVRLRYLRDGVIDGFAYRDYLKLLYEVVPSGQINFYRELTKLK